MEGPAKEFIPEVSPGETFDHHHIFELDDDVFRILIAGDAVTLNDEIMRDWWTREPRVIRDGDRVLVIRRSYLDDQEGRRGRGYVIPEGWTVEGDWPLEEMNLLTLETWLGRFLASPSRLVRDGDVTLNAAIVNHAIERLGAGKRGQPPFRAREWDLSRGGIESSLAEAEKTGFFSGLWWCCSCGYTGDASTYLWVWGGVPFLEVEVDSTSIASIRILPARATPRRGEA